MSKAEIIRALLAQAEEIGQEIQAQAQAGDILACEQLHAQVGCLQEAADILQDRA